MLRWLGVVSILLLSPAVHAEPDALGDELPPHAALRLGTARLVHREVVRALAFSPDGQRLASAGWDGAIVLWEMPSGREVGRLRTLDSVAFSPDGRWLLAPFDRGLRVWDVARLAPRYSIAHEAQPVSYAAYAPDGKRLVAVLYPDHWVLRDADTGKEQRRVREDCPISALAFSPDGAQLACGCGDGSIRLRELKSGKLRATLRGHTKEVRALRFINAQTLVTGSADDTLRFWEVSTENAEEQERITGVHGQGISALALSPDGTLLASGGGMDSDMRVFDAVQRKPLFEVELAYHATAALAFSPDGKRLAAGGWDSRVKLIDIAKKAPLRLSAGHEDGVAKVAFSADGSRVYSGGQDSRVIAWDAATGARLVERVLPSRVSALAARSNGELYIVLGGMWKTLVKDGATLADRRELEGGEFSATSRRELVAITDSARVLLFSSKSALAPLKTGLLEAWSVALSPSGAQLAVGGAQNLQRGGTELWELDPRRLITKLAGHEDHVSALHYTPDGSILVTASYHQVRVWNVQRAALLRAFDLPDQQVRDLALSPDGRSLAAGLGNGTVRLWRWQSAAPSQTLSGHASGVNAVAFSPDGKRLASASEDGSVLIFNTHL
jgi:WD40 repeat protein